MMRMITIFALAIFLFACGNDNSSTDNAKATVEQANVATASPTEANSTTVASDAESVTETNNTATPQANTGAGIAISPGDVENGQEIRQNVTVKTQSTTTPPPPPAPVKTPTVTETVAEDPPPVVEEVVPVAPPKTAPDHAAFDALLRQYVSTSGQVNYGALKGQSAALQTYIDDLSAFPPQSDWAKNATMAYWINAYNAFTLKLIIDNYPLSSIKNLDGGNPWDVKRINLGGSTYSLNQIENEMLRARYGDARIHFAVNCAAASCPPLHNRAFTADNLNSKLTRLTRSFINNEAYNTITPEAITISKIFDWYGGDFGDVKAYVNRYTDMELTDATTVSYTDYDWSLNGN